MTSRERILYAVAAAQPEALPMPMVSIMPEERDVEQQFITVLTGIGGRVWHAPDMGAAIRMLRAEYAENEQVIMLPDDGAGMDPEQMDPHGLQDVALAILQSNLAVAENGAVWVTDDQLVQRVLPFITQHLAVLLPRNRLVATLHDAYRIIGNMDYGFGVFIAGPSKTADIEQSLVLGAHGSISMTVVLVG